MSEQPAYLNSSLPIPQRVADLLSRMTIDEKISQMRNGADALPNHPGPDGKPIPAYDFWSEGLHGVARNGRATVFPQAIGMAATWNPALIRHVADAISDEGRAKYHEALRRKGSTGMYQGLCFWSPNVNIFRDPRWGRGQETWGEDPYLTGVMAAEFVRGIQGDDPHYLKAAACAKHYAVHSGPEKERHTFNAIVSKIDLYSTYLPAFKKLVEDAKVEIVMGAYNRTLGEACNASTLLLGEILRGQWGFEGHVVSDCGALTDLHRNHKVTADGAESAALALKNGCDIGCDCVFYDNLKEALERGLVTEADIDVALSRTLGTRFKLGMFDPADQVPYAAMPMSVVNSPEHRELAYQTAVESIVLLKNDHQILPIRSDVKSICVVGPVAGDTNILLGNYFGLSDTLTTLIEGIVGSAPEGVKIEYRTGAMLSQPIPNPVDWSIYEAAASDVTIACMGISPLMEGEEGDAILTTENGDRAEIGLPQVQVDYIKRLVVQGAKVVLVLSGGSPITLGEIADMVEAVVFIWYPGQEGGRAVADVLFGKAAPSGKLPLTFPKSLDQLPPFEDYNMIGHTHRYAEWEPLFPFGFGLSYTQFTLDNLSLAQKTLSAGAELTFTVEVRNQGQVAGDEVVQVYLTDIEASFPVPLHNLVAFRKVALAAGESRTLSFSLPAESMMLFDYEGKQRLEAGEFRLTVADCAPGARGQALGAVEPVSDTFWVK